MCPVGGQSLREQRQGWRLGLPGLLTYAYSPGPVPVPVPTRGRSQHTHSWDDQPQ